VVVIRTAAAGILPAILLLALVALAEEPDAGATSVWSGVYSEAQAQRGAAIYPSICGRCHGYKLDGAPDDPDMFSTLPIAGPKFLRNWNGNSLGALFEYTRTTMPEINPGSLSDQEFVAVIAYMLSVTGMPAGAIELPPDVSTLAAIRLEPEP